MTTKALYEHILEAKKYTKDEHWVDILDSCARNRFPKGAKYNHNKNILYVRTDATGRLKTETLTLPQDPKNCYETLMHVFKNLLGLKSDNDIKKSKQQLEDARQKNYIELNCEWKKLKPRTVKNHILMNFVMEKIEEHELHEKNVTKLYKLIQLGIQFKQLSSDDFEYEDGIIYSIKGLEYDEDINFFTLTNKQGALSHVSLNKNANNHLEKSVDRWIKDYNTYTNIKV
jgi:hypothetical protein